MANVKIGCSGFMYNDWRGNFYPEVLPKRRWFEFYTSVFDTVEMNVTFYRLPKEETFSRWYERSPDGYSFSVKGSRYITHVKRLIDTEEAIENLFGRVKRLKEKLSVVLWQFPPSMGYDGGRFRRFLSLISRYRVRQAFEFRHEGWINEEAVDLLGEHGHCLCMADWPKFNDDLPVTTGFVYIRRHGRGGGYNTCYSLKELRRDAGMIKGHLRKGLDVFIYFNNDVLGYAPKNALRLRGML